MFFLPSTAWCRISEVASAHRGMSWVPLVTSNVSGRHPRCKPPSIQTSCWRSLVFQFRKHKKPLVAVGIHGRWKTCIIYDMYIYMYINVCIHLVKFTATSHDLGPQKALISGKCRLAKYCNLARYMYIIIPGPQMTLVFCVDGKRSCFGGLQFLQMETGSRFQAFFILKFKMPILMSTFHVFQENSRWIILPSFSQNYPPNWGKSYHPRQSCPCGQVPALWRAGVQVRGRKQRWKALQDGSSFFSGRFQKPLKRFVTELYCWWKTYCTSWLIW